MSFDYYQKHKLAHSKHREKDKEPTTHLKGWIYYSGLLSRRRTQHIVNNGDLQSENIDDIDCDFCKKCYQMKRLKKKIGGNK